MKRQSAILGMHGKCVSDKEAFEEFAHEFSSEEFHEKMRDAVKNPAGESAKFVLRKIVPFLTTAGRKTVFGAVERNKCAGEILALGRKYGCASDFLTFGIDDVNHPNAIRFAVSSSDNDSFPSRISNASHVAMARGLTLKSGDEGMIPFNWSDRHKRMIENPVGAALAYKQVVEDVMSILVGMKTERKGDKTNLTSPSDPDSVGFTGTPWAYFGKSETTGSGALHFHVILWGGLSPELLEEVSSVSELCSAVASVLNSTHCACLESHHHVRDLVVKETKEMVKNNKQCTTAAQDTWPPPGLASRPSHPGASAAVEVEASTLGSRPSRKESRENSADAINLSSSRQTQLKRRKASEINDAFANRNRNIRRCTCSQPTRVPRALQTPPDPAGAAEDYIWHCSGTILHCGIHNHTFTCRKPPKGWDGCRLCKPSGLSFGTRPVELRTKLEANGKTTFELVIPENELKNHTSVKPWDPEVHHPKEILCFR